MNEKTRTENSILNISAGMVGQVVTLVSSFLCRMVFVRCLSEEYMGVNGLFASIISMLSLAELGIGSAMGFELYQAIAKKDKEQLSAYLKLYGRAYRIIGLLIGFVGLIILPLIPHIVTQEVHIKESLYGIYLFYLANTVISYFFSYKGSIINADQRGYQLTVLGNVIQILQNATQAIVLFATHSFYAYLFCQTVAVLISNLLTAYLSDKQYPFINEKTSREISPDNKKRLFKNVRALVITKVGSYMVSGTDSIIITMLDSLSMAGITSNFGLLTSALNNIILQIFKALSPSVGNLNAAVDLKYKKQIFWDIDFMCFWLFGWSTVSFLVLGNDIVQICFGETYKVSTTIIFALGLNYYTIGMMNTVSMYKETLGLFDYGKTLNLVTGIVNLVVSVLLGKIWGTFGILIATTIARMLTIYSYYPYAVFKYGFHESSLQYFKRYVAEFGIMALTYVILRCISQQIQLGIPISFIVKLVICCVIPNALFWVILHKTNEYKHICDRVIGIIQRIIKR